MVFTMHMKPPVGAGAPCLPEQRFKKVTEIMLITTARRCAMELKTGAPVRWWLKTLLGIPIRTQLVVSGTFFRILENLVGLTQILEFLLSIRFLADIRMILSGQFSIGTFDLILGGFAIHTQNCVIVLIFHDYWIFSFGAYVSASCFVSFSTRIVQFARLELT